MSHNLAPEAMPKWRRAVVTGAGGFIGKSMTAFLRRKGIQTLAIDRTRRPEKAPIDIVLDLSVPNLLDPFLGEDVAIFHLAGSADVRGSVRSPILDFHDNVLPTLNILESARKAGSLMLYPSTGSIYDSSLKKPLTEASPVRPSSPYGAAKVAGEAYCFAYQCSYGLDVRIARMFSVYGPGMRRFAIYDFFNRLREHPHALTIRGNGDQTRDYLFIDDTVSALFLLMTAGETGGVYNVASGQSISVLEVARTVADAMGLPDRQIMPDGEAFAPEVYHMTADVSRLTSLGFAPSTIFHEGVKASVSWLQRHAEIP